VAAARTGAAGPGALIGAMRRFVARVPRVPLLDRRLEGIGESAGVDPELMRGPVARAAGNATDVRLGDDAYTTLGFSPVVRTGGDALARLQVRLGEISASLDLVLAATSGPSAELRPARLPADLSGSAGAAVETPRGMAGLHIAVERGMVTMAHIDPPSVGHAALVPALTTGAEVADALVAVASLDLSPWEVAP
ncbi:MAG: hypothetical protein IT338_19340, partial [Thermomicrobiales bacterium]|nr:hypothetical protein [Thermomicrobiales bacterium]